MLTRVKAVKVISTVTVDKAAELTMRKTQNRVMSFLSIAMKKVNPIYWMLFLLMNI
jgi:hypothetical protein